MDVDSYRNRAISAEREPVMGQPAPSGPMYSEDGHWWWDGQQWRPAPAPTQPGPSGSRVASSALRGLRLPLIGAGLAVLVGAGLLASMIFGLNRFAGPPGDDTPSGPDVLTPIQASAVVSTFWSSYVIAQSKDDQLALQGLFTGPALQALKANPVQFALRAPAWQASHINIAVPHQAHYPLRLMAQIAGQEYQNGLPNGGAIFYVVLTRADPSAPWLSPMLSMYLELPPLRSDGYAASPLSSSQEGRLAERPDNVPADYARTLEALQSGQPAAGIFANEQFPEFAPDPGFRIRGSFTPDPAGLLLRSRTSAGGEVILFVIDGKVTLDRLDGACMNPRSLGSLSNLRSFFTGPGSGIYRRSELTFSLYVELEIPTGGQRLAHVDSPLFDFGPNKIPC